MNAITTGTDFLENLTRFQVYIENKCQEYERFQQDRKGLTSEQAASLPYVRNLSRQIQEWICDYFSHKGIEKKILDYMASDQALDWIVKFIASKKEFPLLNGYPSTSALVGEYLTQHMNTGK